jgi:hypothetical protein
MSDMLLYLIGKSGIDVPESRRMEGDGRAAGASDRDEKEGAGSGASFHANQHRQSGFDIQESRTLEGAEDSELQVMETSLRVLGAEHPKHADQNEYSSCNRCFRSLYSTRRDFSNA